MSTTVRSFSKINLGLAVGPPRPDGFHGLTTMYQTLALHDEVRVTAEPASRTRIKLEADHRAVPSTARGDAERNTAYRIVAGALERMGVRAEVELTITKRLPIQGGLGAGSANAAAALLGLERELSRALPGADRMALGAEIGSDVPLFLLGGTVLGLNRGEAVYPLPDSPALTVVVAVPAMGVSTAQAFRDLDARGSANLTEAPEHDRLTQLSRTLASLWTHSGTEFAVNGIADLPNDGSEQPAGGGTSVADGDLAGNPLLALVRTGVVNDFEDVAFRQHPSLCEIKAALVGEAEEPGSRAIYAALSGSGSALFGIFRDGQAALGAQQRVESLGSKAFLTETLSRRGYWKRMFA